MLRHVHGSCACGKCCKGGFVTKFRASTLPALATSRAGRAITMRYLRPYSFVLSSQWRDDYAPLADNPAPLFPPVRFERLVSWGYLVMAFCSLACPHFRAFATPH